MKSSSTAIAMLKKNPSVSFTTKRKTELLVLLTCLALLISYFSQSKQKVDVTSASSASLARRLILDLLVDTTEVSTGARRIDESYSDDDELSDDNPIAPNNKICNDYLKKFFEGSTDIKDECDGFENAYTAAECAKDVVIAASNSTGDDEVPEIDDGFENFECCKFIQSAYSEKCLFKEVIASLSLLGVVSVLILCGFVKTLIHGLKLQWLPEAGGCILVGASVGAILTASLPQHRMNLGTFDDDLFLFILLPPIIFHAALSIDKSKFYSLIFPIAMFAVFGTIISAVITGFIVHGLTSLGWTKTIPLLDSMIFGALISSVDPVATLSILGSMGVSNTNLLYVIVFGESILNDGVSIAMFESLVLHLNGDTEAAEGIVRESIIYFLQVTFISIVIGLVCGFMCTIYFWSLRGRQSPVSEVASFFCFALVAYYISDGLKCSGIVSIMIIGFFMDVFVRGRPLTRDDLHREILQSEESGTLIDGGAILPPRCCTTSCSDWRVIFSGVGHISHRAKIHVGFVSDVLSNLMETAIFAYLGLFLFDNKKWDDFPLIFTGIFSSVLSRVLMIGIISIIVNGGVTIQNYLKNYFQRNPEHLSHSSTATAYIDRKMQVILLYSGVRGAVSLALVENIPIYNAVTKHGSLYKPALKSMTSASIIFTVFFFGASTYDALKRQRQNIQLDDELSSLAFENEPRNDRIQREDPLENSSLTSLLLENNQQTIRHQQELTLAESSATSPLLEI